MCSGRVVPSMGSALLRAEEDVVLPAGEYRYVASYDYLDNGSSKNEPAAANIVSVKFTIPGFGQPEVARINSIISEIENLHCPEVTDWVIDGAARFATPATVRLLLDAQVSELRTHMRLVQAMTRVADNNELIQQLLDGQKGPLFSIAAALVFADQRCPISACGWESPNCADALCTEVIERLASHFRTNSDYLDEIALALSQHVEKWPPGLMDQMLEVLGTTSSPTLREVLFFDVVCEHLVGVISDEDKTHTKVIRALKRALLKETRPAVKKEMRGQIRSLEKEDVISYLMAAQAPRVWSDTLDIGELDQRCRSVFEDAKARVSFPDHPIPPVNVEPSIIEPYTNAGLPLWNEPK